MCALCDNVSVTHVFLRNSACSSRNRYVEAEVACCCRPEELWVLQESSVVADPSYHAASLSEGDVRVTQARRVGVSNTQLFSYQLGNNISSLGKS